MPRKATVANPKSTSANRKPQELVSYLDNHTGWAILRLAGTYRRLPDAVFEAVQNAIDEDSSLITVTVDLQKGEVAITDDGLGRPYSEVTNEVFRSIGESLKGKGKMGRFGLGFISMIGKCEYHTFTTSARGANEYWEWTFAADEIKKHRDKPPIVGQVRPELRFGDTQDKRNPHLVFVPWQTQIHMVGVTRDSLGGFTTPKEIEDGILERFSLPMVRKKVRVRLLFTDANGEHEERNITASQHRGKALKVLRLKPKPDHEVEFRLFIAPKTSRGRKGVVALGEIDDDFTFSAQQFRLPAEGLISRGAAHALISGIFEGYIRSNRATLNVERNGFVRDDRYLEVIEAIDEWFDAIGVHHVLEVNEDTRWRKYQDLGNRATRLIANMLKDDQWTKIYESFRVGHVGKGHADVGAEVVKDSETKFLSTEGGSGKTRGKQKGKGGQPSNKKDSSKSKNTDRATQGDPWHRPHVTQGPGGGKRTFVREDSTGLMVLFAEMPAQYKRYVLSDDTFQVEINVRHPLFVECEEKGNTGTALLRYIENTLCEAITMYEIIAESPDRRDEAEQFFLMLFKKTVFQIVSADRRK